MPRKLKGKTPTTTERLFLSLDVDFRHYCLHRTEGDRPRIEYLGPNSLNLSAFYFVKKSVIIFLPLFVFLLVPLFVLIYISVPLSVTLFVPVSLSLSVHIYLSLPLKTELSALIRSTSRRLLLFIALDNRTQWLTG